MKYWENVSTQEQRTLKRGLIVIVIMVILRFVWWPLYDGINQKQQDITTEIDLIDWMKPIVTMIMHSKEPIKPMEPGAPRLSTIEKAFAQAGLSPFVKNLSQQENQTIMLQARAVPFGALAVCLEDIARNHGIVPESLTATRQKTGVVDVEIIFLGK